MLKMLLAAWLLAVGAALPASAMSVIPLYLDELVDRSRVAFEGTCVDNRIEREAASGLVVTYTTFAVNDRLKGGVPATLVIKQIGGQIPGEGLQYDVPGVPRFTPGEDYVVFLAGVSPAGFSSPLGLGQGRFQVRRGAEGAKVGSGRDFRDLAANIPPEELSEPLRGKLKDSPARVHELGLEEFKELVRSRLGRSR
jgi:hypothetical protein